MVVVVVVVMVVVVVVLQITTDITGEGGVIEMFVNSSTIYWECCHSR